MEPQSILTTICHFHPKLLQQEIDVCIEPKCNQDILLCGKCRTEEFHKNHKIVSIKQLQKRIDKEHYEESISLRNNWLQKEVNQLESNCFKKLQQFRQKINYQISQTETILLQFFTTTKHKQKYSHQKFKSNFQQTQKIEKEYSFQEIRSKASQQKLQYLLQQSLNQKFIGKLNQVKAVVKERQELLSKYIKDVMQHFCAEHKKITQILSEEACFDVIPTNFAWSARLKSPDLRIQKCTLERTQKYQSCAVCCLGNWLMGASPTTYKWSIKILKMVGRIFIGISKTRFNEKYNFIKGSWDSIGHGNYVIQNDGHKYSDHDRYANDDIGSFEFGAGDIVSIQYNPNQGKVTFYKNSAQKKFEMNVIRGYPFRASGYLFNTGSCLEIGQW